MIDEILRTFYGTKDIPRFVILTPISKLYKKIIESMYVTKEREGWWRNTEVTTEEGRNVLVIKTYPGNAIVDPLISLNYKDTFLISFGFCGGISPKINIGDVLVANESYFFGKDELYRPSFDMKSLESLKKRLVISKNVTVDSVILSQNITANIHKDTSSCDQETAYLYSLSENPSVSIMVVSDLPLRKPFYRIEKEDISRIDDGISDAISSIISLLQIIDK